LAHAKHTASPEFPKQPDPLAEKWLKKLKNNWLIAVVIVAGTIILAVVEFGQKTSEFYEKHVQVPVSLEAIEQQRYVLRGTVNALRTQGQSSAYFSDSGFDQGESRRVAGFCLLKQGAIGQAFQERTTFTFGVA